jgi:macrolide transport system ATP-binding/permease protein
MLLSVRNMTKSYGAMTVLSALSFVINAQDRVGLIGPNGVGKSTLLRLLTGQEKADHGSLQYASDVEYGYLPQSTPIFYGETIDDLLLSALGNLRQLEERMRLLESQMSQASEDDLPGLLETYGSASTRFQERGGYDLDATIGRVLNGLQIDYLARTRLVQTLSGGEKARMGLAALLLRSPDVLFLDEPTNHLDFASLEWLESYLTAYRGALLIVSHDRRFLNRIINQIFEIDEHQHELKIYAGDYDAYVQAKSSERAKWEEEYQRQQEELQELRRRIRDLRHTASQTSFGPTRDGDKFALFSHTQKKQGASASRLKGAEQQLKLIEADPIPKPPKIIHVHSSFQGEPLQSQVAIRLIDVSKSFGERTLLQHQSLEISSAERIVLTGANGTGKTTLFKMIIGTEQPTSGEIVLAPSLRIGYLPQETLLDPDKTVIETYRYDQIGYEDELAGRLIGYGLFRLEDLSKQVGQLSLGQKRKLEIACLMAQAPNVLLLDEPTNYISWDVLAAFEQAILDFPGPVITVTHDRWFIQRIGGALWTLEAKEITAGRKGKSS